MSAHVLLALVGLGNVALGAVASSFLVVEWDELSWRSVVWVGAALAGGVGLQFFLALDCSERLRRERPWELLAAAAVCWALPVATGPRLLFGAGLPVACALILFRGRRRWALAALFPVVELLVLWWSWPRERLGDSLGEALWSDAQDIVMLASLVTLFTAFAYRSRHPGRPAMFSGPRGLWLVPVVLSAVSQLVFASLGYEAEDSRRELVLVLFASVVPVAVVVRMVFASPRRAWPTLSALALGSVLLMAYGYRFEAFRLIGVNELPAIFGAVALFLLPVRRALPLLLAASALGGLALAICLRDTLTYGSVFMVETSFALAYSVEMFFTALWLWAAARMAARTGRTRNRSMRAA